MKIPFDIKFRPQIESGEYKVETRDGRPVRIICWDKSDDDCPLVALVRYEDGSDKKEIAYTFGSLGYWCRQEGKIISSGLDLFIITPEQELSEEDKGILLECISALQNSSHWLLADKLKSLRPQPHWKPSEQEMHALARATNRCVGVEDAKKLLKLLEQLEKVIAYESK